MSPCRCVDLGNGVHAIVCGRASRPKPCSVCGRPGMKLCDGPGTQKGATCDKVLCGDCATRVEGDPSKDYCPAHRPTPKPIDVPQAADDDLWPITD